MDEETIVYRDAPKEWHDAVNKMNEASLLLAMWYAKIHHEPEDSEIILRYVHLKGRVKDFYNYLHL